MTWLQPITLRSERVNLEPLNNRHLNDLILAVKDGSLWQLWYTYIPKPEMMDEEIRRRLELQATGNSLPFAVIDNLNRQAVGMTSFVNSDPINRRLEIGFTWYRMAVQRTALNTQCKLLLLQHAFEKLECIAVEFRTHFFNHQSRAAIERLGAKLDGILRCHQVAMNGLLRDTCVYSIIASEWPAVRSHLTWELMRPRLAT